jgi:hypothetical protein
MSTKPDTERINRRGLLLEIGGLGVAAALGARLASDLWLCGVRSFRIQPRLPPLDLRPFIAFTC